MITCLLENDNPWTQKIRDKHCKRGMDLEILASTTPITRIVLNMFGNLDCLAGDLKDNKHGSSEK